MLGGLKSQTSKVNRGMPASGVAAGPNRSFMVGGAPLPAQLNDRVNVSCLNNRSMISDLSKNDISAYMSRERRPPGQIQQQQKTE